MLSSISKIYFAALFEIRHRKVLDYVIQNTAAGAFELLATGGFYTGIHKGTLEAVEKTLVVRAPGIGQIKPQQIKPQRGGCE